MKRLCMTLLVAAAILSGCDTGLAPDGATLPAITSAVTIDAGNGVMVEPAVTTAIQRDGAADYLVYFDERPDLSAAAGMDWIARGRFVYESLSKAADASQAPAIAVLQANNVKFRAFWIDNVIAVTKSDRATLNSIQSMPGVTRIIAPRRVGIIEPETRKVSVSAGVNAIEPNIDHVGASAVWTSGITGAGIVVANVDTGVRYTHGALVNHYRGNNGDGTFDHTYNWYDPYTMSPAPLDENGHGSHTMGTMIGGDGSSTNQIGMAPGATWIACRGCDTSSCSDANLLACAQWVAAPTDLTGANPNPDLRPNIVNNSWGDCSTSYDPWYQGAVDTWHAAGIYPVFSNGNASNCSYSEPPACNTVGNPGRYGNVTGVGSTTQSSGQYANHSLRGPTDNLDTVNPQADPGIKPQVVAPGVDIRSAVATGDDAFESWGGTSMSAPHVAGLIALAWQAAPCLVGDYANTENLIERTATPIPYSSTCGGAGSGDVPNNVTGWGEINAPALVQLAAEWCGPSGTVRGMVTNLGGSPLPDVTITLGGHTATTAADGTYRIDHVPVGTWDLTAESFWYQTATVTGLVVSDGLETIQDIVMTPRPAAHVSGTVIDGSGHGWPLYAIVWIIPPGATDGRYVFTDPFTGAWAADVIAGEQFTYQVQTWLPGYQTVAYAYTAPGDQTGVVLPVPVSTCDMVGYTTASTPLYFADFEAHNGGMTLSGTNTSMAWGSPTTGPGSAYSGANVWATNLAGNYYANEADYLQMPVIDASAGVGDLVLSWWQYLVSETNWDFASVQASHDGGANWNTVWGRTSGAVSSAWTQVTVALGPEYHVSNLKIRFVFTSDSSIVMAGWYIDDVALNATDCVTTPAGLVAGFAYDSATTARLNYVLVTGAGSSNYSTPTEHDPAIDDGLYVLPMPVGPAAMTGAMYGYSTANVFPTVIADTVTRQDIPMANSTPVTMTGTVRDGNGQGWPLYSRVTFESVEYGDTFATWTDPFTGRWSMQLFDGYQYNMTVTPVVPGYDMWSATFVVDSTLPVLDLMVTSSTCTSPGMDPDTCALIPGGMFGGYVTESATGEFLVGATVHVGTTTPWVSMATPEDDNANDGLYYVFAANDDPASEVELKADFHGMTPYMQSLGVVHGDLVRHDIAITEARFAFDAADLEFRFLAGSNDSDGPVVGLVNSGEGRGEFELVERPIGVTAAPNAADPRILTYYTQPDQATSGDPLAVAIAALGYTPTAYYNDQHAQFLTALAEGGWDLVIYDGSLSCDIGVFDELSAYVQAGGKLVFSCWQFWNVNRDAQLLVDLGVNIVDVLSTATPSYKWMDHDLFDQVESVPDFTSPTDPGFGLTGFIADAYNGSYAVAGTTTAAAPGAATMIVGNANRTVWRGITDYANTGDVDTDGVADAVELWSNTVEYLLTGGFSDVPWLSEDPVSGVLDGGASMPIGIMADSTGMPAGSYRAQVLLRTPNSRTDVEPLTVTMEVGHLLTVVQSPNGRILPEGRKFIVHDSDVELWFNADSGYHVQNVIINGVSHGRQDYMLLTNVQEDLLVTAEFEFTCHGHDDCTHPDNDCVGFCNVDTCERLKVKPVGAACGDQRDTDCSQPDTCDGAGTCLPNHESPMVVCRLAEGGCDAMDYCTGDSNDCPDAKLTTQCRASEGICDVADFCNGVDNDCPADEKAPVSRECRVLQGECDVQDFCNGVDNDCPVDGKAPTTQVCRPSIGECDRNDYCNGVDDDCPADEKLTVECRSSVGECDKADFCNGVDPYCPFDEKLTTECRGVQGACDVAESCNGIDNTCPFDQKLPATTECRPADGVCDAADYCTGVDDACPDDEKLPAMTECRVSGGVCDLVDFCDGASNACLGDAKAPATVACRASAGVCDTVDFCNGVDDACPIDVKEPATTECRVSRGVCDATDFCDGVNDACPTDVKLTTECRAAAGECDAAESCDGVADHCPADVKLTTECRAAAGVCDAPESCNGIDNTCPYDLKLTTECRAAAGECDAAETCDGVADDCPMDGKLVTECRASRGECDQAETCDGVGDACPEDMRSTAECRPAAGVCDASETCTGADDACPADVKLTTECRGVNGVCDVAEMCDGVGDDCPADAFSNTATCDDGNPCTSGDTCDGTGAACVSTVFTCEPGPCDESVACDGQGGCVPTFKTIGTECDDGIACTTGETCQAGGQCVAETVLVCDAPPEPECVDADTSRVYVADGICGADAQDCEYESHVFACDDGCDAETGLCAETDVTCPATVTPPCMVDLGYPVYDRGSAEVICYMKPIAAGTACDDADECTIGETCDGDGACVGEPNPACVAEPERDVIGDTGTGEDTGVVQDTVDNDVPGEDLGPHNDDDDGCSAGTGSGTHLGWLMLGLCVAVLAILRRRRVA